MNIKINGKPLDITLETETTLGEVLTGIQIWLDDNNQTAGLSISKFEIDGKNSETISIDDAFKLPIDNISLLDITTSSWAELMLQALYALKNDLAVFEQYSAEERQNYSGQWENSAASDFIKRHEPNLYLMILATLQENPGAISITSVVGLVAERIREIENPAGEVAALLPVTEETAKRLEDMPLDMQTGKDLRAAETITLFSALMEKMFRIIALYKYFGIDIEKLEIDAPDGEEKQPFSTFILEFNTALKELVAAYENKDTVLVGDLAEYELAPRLITFATVIRAVKIGGQPAEESSAKDGSAKDGRT